MLRPAHIVGFSLLAVAAVSRASAADPLAEIKASSDLGALDAKKLKAGEVYSVRGAQGSFARGVYVENCFYVPASPEKVSGALMQWDPSKHPRDEVSIYQLYHHPASVDFARVAQLKNERATDKWMLARSAESASSGKPGELYLNAAEAKSFRSAKSPSEAWERILSAHAEATATGGLQACPSYSSGNAKIAPHSELGYLLHMMPRISAHFTEVTSDSSSGESAERAYYAEQSLNQGHTSFSLGELVDSHAGENWRVMDCTYYVSDTFCMSVDLYAVWPWEGGSLVWQIDAVSAPFRAYAQGLDKMFAGRQMAREAADSIRDFRDEVVKPR